MIVPRLLNSNFQMIHVIDEYESMIWTDRYNEAGDFEIVFAGTKEVMSTYEIGQYVEIDESEHTMVLETITTEADAESGVKIKISGRSLESILDRRIFLSELSIPPTNAKDEQKPLWFNVRRCFYKTLMKNGDNNPEGNPNRVISNFIFTTPTEKEITDIIAEEQDISIGDNLYDVIVDICQERYLGWKLVRNEDKFVFSFYKGVNRSNSQEEAINPYVIFSPNFENIINSSFVNSITTLKNTAFMSASDDDGKDVTTIYPDDNDKATVYTGLDRREVSLNINNARQNGKSIDTFKTKLRSKAKKELAKSGYRETKSFTGKIDASNLFVYGVDFQIGDIVQIGNELDIESSARITEFVMSIDSSGTDFYPTFMDTNDEE